MADLSKPVSELELSVRTSEALQQSGVRTVGELAGLTREALVMRIAGDTPSLKDIMRLKRSITELEDVLRGMGLGFVEHSDPDAAPESVKDVDIPNMLDEEEFD